jgi:hypothetical protein
VVLDGMAYPELRLNITAAVIETTVLAAHTFDAKY